VGIDRGGFGGEAWRGLNDPWGRRMFRNEVAGLEHALDVRAMDAGRDVHYHLLGTFGNAAIDAEVRSLESFESKAEKKVRLNSEMTEGEKLTSCDRSRDRR
jgi:hypothetical protein